MGVIEIEATASRGFNHPYEQFSNYRRSVTIRASLGADENPQEAVAELQSQAHNLVEKDKAELLMRLTDTQREKERLAGEEFARVGRERAGMGRCPGCNRAMLRVEEVGGDEITCLFCGRYMTREEFLDKGGSLEKIEVSSEHGVRKSEGSP